MTIELFIGESSVQDAKDRAARLPHIVIATPKRAKQLVEEGYLRCENISMFCLDEADEMLSEELLDQVQSIFQYLSPTVQILLFSDTIPYDIFQTMNQMMNDPIQILVKEEKLPLEGIQQFYVDFGQRNFKWVTLLDLYKDLHSYISKAIIFANSKQTVQVLVRQFQGENFTVGAIHSGLTYVEKKQILKDFRTGKIRVLVSTDLLAKGIHFPPINIVINYELPKLKEAYFQRISRSRGYGKGRMIVINICDSDDVSEVSNFEKYFVTKIRELPADIRTILQQINDENDNENNNE